MKKTFTLIFLALTNISFAQDCSQGRYKDEIFSTVDITSDIQYGSNVDKNGNNVNLKLDIYQPTNDTAKNRALIIMAHGGSFVGGSKTGDDVVNLCTDFAKKGYVVASIDYRLGMNGVPFPGPDSADATEAVYRAVQDGRAAVRFFRKDFSENSNTYGIDTNMIFFSGVSAGGFIALHLAYLDEVSEIPTFIDTVNQLGLSGGLEGYSGNTGYSSKVKAIVNMQGALGNKNWLTTNSVPVLSLHGTNDDVVPYNTAILYMLGTFEIMEVDGSSTIATQADAVGVNNCYKQFNGAVHTPHCCGNPNETEYYDTTKTYMTGFLAQFTCGESFICSDDALFSSVSELQNKRQTFEVYPNPATDMLTIKTDLSNTISVKIYDILGKQILNTWINSSTFSIDVSEIESGYYFVKISNESGSLTKKIILE